ncbi:hypothetical protein ACGFSG_35025 [Streptomyces sp. NPDC048512]|uniref:hypothetical protein n=1 Tax=unclassified Streptomyces TaxID=2593676 RepID=UPI0015C46077|nr:hypothetical protein [Streptomyces sp. M41(2017)]
MSNEPRDDRHSVALLLMGTAFAGLLAVLYPGLVPALGVAAAVFMALYLFLRL